MSMLSEPVVDHGRAATTLSLDGRQTAGRKGLAYPWIEVLTEGLVQDWVRNGAENEPASLAMSRRDDVVGTASISI
jgi:hypothetical protein